MNKSESKKIFTGKSKNEAGSSLSNNGGESPKKGLYRKTSLQDCREASRGSEVSILAHKVRELVAKCGIIDTLPELGYSGAQARGGRRRAR